MNRICKEEKNGNSSSIISCVQRKLFKKDDILLDVLREYKKTEYEHVTYGQWGDLFLTCTAFTFVRPIKSGKCKRKEESHKALKQNN